MGLGDSKSTDDPFDTDGFDTDTRTSRFCTICGTTTTVTDGEVKYCGSCGRKLKKEDDWNPLLDESEDYEFKI